MPRIGKYYNERKYCTMNYLTSASLLSCNFCNIGSEIHRAEKAGVDWIHFDVMDGRFVEQITLGAPVLKRVRRVTDMVLDVHLMVENPAKQIGFFAEAGADRITIHAESDCDISVVLENIHNYGKKAALAISPETPVERVYDYLRQCDMILIMTVKPGYGGQSLIPETLLKIKTLRDYLNQNGYSGMDIQVDGGINAETAAAVKAAGANVFVAGSALFRAEDMKAANDRLKA